MLIAWDIETGPLPGDESPPFDPSSVKLGNVKDPEKQAAKIAEAEAAHRDRAALSALTGRVLAITLRPDDDTATILAEGQHSRSFPGAFNSEAAVLQAFWDTWLLASVEARFVGFNIRGFDLPFLYRRSMILGVDVPRKAMDRRGYWHESFVDLLDVWRCGDRQLFVKLDALAFAFGLEGKLDGVTGADFARLWDEDRDTAIAYALQDAELTLKLAQRMGV